VGSLRSALRGGRLETTNPSAGSLRAVIIATLAVTLLNPHFYLDTVVLLGSVSSQFQGQNRLYFWMGAISASTLWFLSLSLGGQMLAPLFRKPMAWRVLDSLVCATMWTIAGSLIVNELGV
jgi:L-lysine exporter family protein LysE/ArgO